MRQIPNTSDKERIVIFVIDIALKSGARGRNRTTDTRNFNRDGNKYLNENSKLYERKFGV